MDARTIQLISRLEETRLLLEAMSLEPNQNLTYTLRSDINNHADSIKKSYKNVRDLMDTKDLSIVTFLLLGFTFIAISVIMILQGIDWQNVSVLVVGILLVFLSIFAFKTRIPEDKRQHLNDGMNYLIRDLRTYGSLRSISDKQAIETIAEIDTLIDSLKETFG